MAANGGGLVQSTPPGTSASTTSLVTVTIPGIVGIDIESDVNFDLSTYLASTPPSTGACPANTFPPPTGCTGAAVYAATGNPTTAGVPTPPTNNTGNIWMSVFCNKTTGTLDIQASISAFNASPGFASSAVRIKRSTTNNAVTVGFAAATALSTTAASIGIGTLGATFGWTRADQLFDMSIPNGSTVNFVEGTYTATATFTISKS